MAVTFYHVRLLVRKAGVSNTVSFGTKITPLYLLTSFKDLISRTTIRGGMKRVARDAPLNIMWFPVTLN